MENSPRSDEQRPPVKRDAVRLLDRVNASLDRSLDRYAALIQRLGA